VQRDGAWYFQSNECALYNDIRDVSSSGGEDGSSGEELFDDNGGFSDSDTSVEDGNKGSRQARLRVSKNEDWFGPIRQLLGVPNVDDYTKSTFGDIDGNGKQNLIVSDDLGRSIGFYERLGDSDGHGWSSLQPISTILNTESSSSSGAMTSLRLNLTGDGLPDFLVDSNPKSYFRGCC